MLDAAYPSNPNVVEEKERLLMISPQRCATHLSEFTLIKIRNECVIPKYKTITSCV